MSLFRFSSLAKWRGATVAGIFSVALGSVLLLCGAGSAPIENLLPQGAMQGDLNAGGYSVTNAATVQATNAYVNALTVTNSLGSSSGAVIQLNLDGSADFASGMITIDSSGNFVSNVSSGSPLRIIADGATGASVGPHNVLFVQAPSGYGEIRMQVGDATFDWGECDGGAFPGAYFFENADLPIYFGTHAIPRMYLLPDGQLCVNASSDDGTGAVFEVNGDVSISGRIFDSSTSAGSSGQILSSTGWGLQWINSTTFVSPPGSHSAAGSPGQWSVDSSYFYIYTGSAWGRIALDFSF